MTTFEDRTEQPRCATCACILPAPGAICHACDMESHFEGVARTAPPLFTHRLGEVRQRPAAHRAS